MVQLPAWARVASFGDHRVAMAFAIAGLFADGETIVQDAGCIRESYPGFEAVLEEFTNPKRMQISTPVIGSLYSCPRRGSVIRRHVGYIRLMRRIASP